MKKHASSVEEWRLVPVTNDPIRILVLKDTIDSIFQSMAKASMVEVRCGSAEPADQHNGYRVKARINGREFHIASRFLGELSVEDKRFLGIALSTESTESSSRA